MREHTTITLSRVNYARLQKLGKVPETFNGIIGRLLDQVEEQEQNKQELQK